MSNLGIATRTAEVGLSDASPIYAGDWVKYVGDVRSDNPYDLIKGINANKVIPILSFVEDGCFICFYQLSEFNSRDDYTTTWLYIPNEIEFESDELYGIVTKIINHMKIDAKDDLYKQICDKPYKGRIRFKNRLGSSDKLGVRYVNEVSLKKLLNHQLYQEYYKSYKYIFLINKDEKLDIIPNEKDKFADLSDRPFQTSYILLPPKDLGKDMSIWIGEKQFISPILVEKDCEINNAEVRRKGFLPNKVNKFKVEQDEKEIPLSEQNKTEWCKKFNVEELFTFIVEDVENINKKGSKAKSNVKDSKGFRSKDISKDKGHGNEKMPIQNDCKLESLKGKIIINGENVKNQSTITLLETQAKKADIRIELDKYDVVNKKDDIEHKKINLFNKPIEIRLQYKECQIEKSIYLVDGSKARLIIKSRRPSLKYMDPILKGYQNEGDEGDVLKYNQLEAWKQRVVGFFVGVCLILLIWGIITFCKLYEIQEIDKIPFFKIEKIEDDNNLQLLENEESMVMSLYDYLDENIVWSKNAMDVYPELDGLYEDLVNYNREQIIGVWDEKLSGSNTFTNIVNLYKSCNSEDFDIENQYNQGNDKFNVDEYIEFIENKSQNRI